METPADPNWITELASQERERRKDYQIARTAATEFQQLLSNQIFSDLHAYYREFPQEAPYIHHANEPGTSIITRLRDENSEYVGVPCQVRFSIEVRQMVVECRFPHRPDMDKMFRIVINAEGALGLADGSVADLSRYLLTPVLFDKLIPPPPGPSEGD